MKRILIGLAVPLAVVAAACGGSSSDTTIPAVLPPIADASGLGPTVDNPYFPFAVGARWVYEGTDQDETERIAVEVLAETRDVNGFTAVVVRDVAEVNGELAEDTFDWYLQDAAGNVWYVGEATEELENGKVVSTAGSWEWGVDGASPGIMMYADPAAQLNQAYYQEFYEGEAEDKAQVVRTGQTVTVAGGTFEDVIVIREWNPLDPGVVEEKSLAPGVGVILEVVVEGGTGRIELISFTTAP